MRTRKLFAILMAGAMSLTMLCSPALASELPEEAPVETVGPTFTPSATEGTLELATEAPVELVTEEPADSEESQQPSDFTGIPTENPTEAPVDPTEVPAVKLSDRYAIVEAGTRVYAERSLKTLLGTFASRQLVYISDTAGEGGVYETHFDTEDTASGKAIKGYFYAAGLQFLAEDEVQGKVSAVKSVRSWSGDKLPVANFEPVAQPSIVEQPEKTEAPDDAPELLVEELLPVEESEPVTEDLVPVEEPEQLDEDLVPVEEPEQLVEDLIPADDPERLDEDLVPAEEPERLVEDLVPTEESEPLAELLAPVQEPETDSRSLAERIDETNPGRSIAVNVAWDAEIPAIGSTATLSMETVGYEGLAYTVFWECDQGDGWQTVHEGEASVSFQVTEENVQWQWRAGVNVIGIETPVEGSLETSDIPMPEVPDEKAVAEAPAAE